MRITVSNVLTVEDVPPEIRAAIRADLTRPNPEYVNRTERGFKAWGISETISLVDWPDLPRGYMTPLLERLDKAGIKPEIHDNRVKLPSLDIPFRGELRPYQKKAVAALMRHGSGMIVAPCGSGKTAMTMYVIAVRRQPALLLCHTKDLAAQLAENVTQWLGIEPGMIGGGTWDVKPVTVALMQSLASRSQETRDLLSRFGLVALDEAHHCPARTFTEIMQLFPAVYRYGVTATPERRDGLEDFMTAVIGPVRHEVRNTDLETAGLLIRPTVEWVPTAFDFDYSDTDDYSNMITALTEDEDRNALIIQIAADLMKQGRQVLILSGRVKHAHDLATALEDIFPDKVRPATSKETKKVRAESLDMMRSGELRCLTATSLADEGLDVRRLSGLILSTPSRSGSKTKQRLGRIMRPAEGKTAPVVYDLVDCNIGVLWSQARSRYFGCYKTLAQGCRLPAWLERTNAA